MLKYLIDREKEEQFRTSTRTLAFPDGTTRKVTAYRLVWRWYDRALAYEFGPDDEEMLGYTLKCMETEKIEDEGEALGQVLEYLVWRDEVEYGADYTDDDLVLMMAKRGMQKFRERKVARKNGGDAGNAAV